MNIKLSLLTILLISLNLAAMNENKKRKKLSGAAAFEQELEEVRESDLRAGKQRAEEQLRRFCKNRSLEPVLSFLAESADISSKDETTGMTPLHYAAANGDYSLAQLLVGKGADLESIDFRGTTPLFHAASEGHHEVVALLHALGANAQFLTTKGVSALHLAAANGRVACCSLLIDLGCSVNAPADNGRTPLHYAAQNNHISAVTELLRRGAHLHARTGGNTTPLHEAVRKGHTGMVKLLLESEPNKAAMAEELTAAFFMALDYYQADDEQRLAVMEMLLKAGANANARSPEGYTFLHLVIRAGHTPIVRLLLTNLADPRIKTPEGTLLPAHCTPLKVAAKKGQSHIVKLLLEYHPDKALIREEMETLLHMVLAECKENDSERLKIIEALLDAGCSPNTLSSQGCSPLQIALWGGHEDIAALLIHRGADLRYLTPSGTNLPEGWNVLHVAAHKVLWQACKLLVGKGLDPMAKTADGQQAVQITFATNLPGSAALAVALHTKKFQEPQQ